MRPYFIFITSLVCVWAISCTKENDLKDSVFIYDTENIDLPAYSEWGYNTFGAYYDRDIFVSNNELVPAKVVVSDTSFTFMLNGEKGQRRYSYNNSEMLISFGMSGFSPGQCEDLVFLHDSVVDLTHPYNHVFVTIDTVKYVAEVLEGAIHFKRIQVLQVDDQFVEVILSGLFGFKAVINGRPVTISDGRFDVGIGPDNFYNF